MKKIKKKSPLPTVTLSSASSSSKAPFLTTKNGLIVDQTGKEVVMKGINWFGWNTNLDATGENAMRETLILGFFLPSSFFRAKEREREKKSENLSLIIFCLCVFSPLQHFRMLSGNFTNGADAVAQDAGWATARAAMMVSEKFTSPLSPIFFFSARETKRRAAPSEKKKLKK